MTLSPFPPSFADNPWSYGLALFSDLIVSAFALAQILAYAFEARRQREVRRRLNSSPPAQPYVPWFSTLNVHRMIVMGLLLTLLSRALPDALLLLAWGEADKATITFLFMLDWYGDTLAMFPFVGALCLVAWSWQAIPQRLIEVANIPLARPKWEQAKGPLKIVVLSIILAVGVTFGKANA